MVIRFRDEGRFVTTPLAGERSIHQELVKKQLYSHVRSTIVYDKHDLDVECEFGVSTLPCTGVHGRFLPGLISYMTGKTITITLTSTAIKFTSALN
jgi:hypothetical protein